MRQVITCSDCFEYEEWLGQSNCDSCGSSNVSIDYENVQDSEDYENDDLGNVEPKCESCGTDWQDNTTICSECGYEDDVPF